MKLFSEFRDPSITNRLLENISSIITKEWTLMEVCGGQTHSIIKTGLDQLIPKKINLIHGPGCPVCVTPLEIIDKAIALAEHHEVIFTSFGDMLRVPGSEKDLFSVKAAGGDIRIVYSPLDAINIARENPNKKVVFFGIGFETTAPANAMAVHQAKEGNIHNFSILVSHVTVPAAIKALLETKEINVDGFLAAGHVCTVMGFWEYEPISSKYEVPIVITGFEPVDILLGIYRSIKQLEEGLFFVENAYSRSVSRDGNLPAQRIINQVFEICDRQWRGIGMIPQSGFHLREEYDEFDAEKQFPDIHSITTKESELCISGLILQGRNKPNECQAFGNICNPQKPLGATMVSNEGACAAYYRYGRLLEK